MTKRKLPKRSKHELKRIVEDAVNKVCRLPERGIWFTIDELETDLASPPSRIKTWSTLHFTAKGSPFCCGEPTCHIGAGAVLMKPIFDKIRRSLNLTQEVTIKFVSTSIVHEGVEFHYGVNDDVYGT